jgi:hypothetical protein
MSLVQRAARAAGQSDPFVSMLFVDAPEAEMPRIMNNAV